MKLFGTKDVPKEETSSKTIDLNTDDSTKKKPPLKSRLKLIGCIVGAILLILLITTGICSFLYAGGWLKDYVCTTVLEDSYIWNKAGCGTDDSSTSSEQEEDEDQEEEDTEEETEEDSSTSSEQEEEEAMYWEYQWYQDDYIKFQYPRGWNVEVYNEEDADSPFKESGYNGVHYIGIGKNNETYLMISLPAARGYDRIKYDRSKPYTVILNPEFPTSEDSTEETITISELPKLASIEKYGIEILVNIECDKYPNIVYGKTTEDDYYSDHGIPKIKLDFMGQSDDPNADYSVIEFNYDFNSEEDYNEFIEFISTFFGTVKKLN